MTATSSAEADGHTVASAGDGGDGDGPGGFRTWFAVTGGIAAWMAHLIGVASLARLACTSDNGIWAVHGLTVAMAAVTIVAMVMSEGLRRAAPGTDQEPVDTVTVSREGFANLEFLGRFGLIVGAANLLLIVFEGSMAVWIPACN